MRRPRVKVEGEGFYHVVSRIGGKRFLIDEKEKAILLGMIRGAAVFSGVELYTFAVMSNHFHLLVRVPRRKEVSDRELDRRMLAWYGPGKFAAILEKWEKWTKKGLEMRVADERDRMRARMYDLSQFCKTFKEAYTQDYNKRHENTGTIWEGRFKSILLEGSFRALMTVAGYVHLNPVRAAMVERPEEGKVSQSVGASSNAQDGGMETSPSPEANAADDVIERDEKGRMLPPKTVRGLLRRRVAGFLHGGALGGERFLHRVAGCLPPRMRRRAEGLFDECSFLGLNSAAGVRGAS